MIADKTLNFNNSWLATLKKVDNVKNKYLCGSKCDKLEMCTIALYENKICFLMTGYLDLNDQSAFTSQKDSTIFVNKKKSKRFIYFNTKY